MKTELMTIYDNAKSFGHKAETKKQIIADYMEGRV